MEQQLIALYLRVCRAYDSEPDLKYQRLSNFRPAFTDEELVAIYLFGHMQGFQQQRHIYDYARRHWRAWFPALPSCQAFNRRLNRPAPAFERLITAALATPVAGLAAQADRLIDSFPVILAKWPRSGAARAASQLASQGYCATERSYYYGVQLHVIALRRAGRLPLPALVHLSRASRHDLATLRELDPDLGDGHLFGGKAYADEEARGALAERGTHLLTPYERRRNEPETAAPALWSRFVSSVRQPLEALFGWLIQRTGLQKAARVRSTDGLLVHCYGKLAVACLLLTFNP